MELGPPNPTDVINALTARLSNETLRSIMLEQHLNTLVGRVQALQAPLDTLRSTIDGWVTGTESFRLLDSDVPVIPVSVVVAVLDQFDRIGGTAAATITT